MTKIALPLSVIGLILVILSFLVLYTIPVDERIILTILPFGTAMLAGGLGEMIPNVSEISGKRILLVGFCILLASILSLGILPEVTSTIEDASHILNVLGVGIMVFGGLKMMSQKKKQGGINQTN
ncbi:MULTISPECIES: hypothetical protein [Oceanobacillus]|uniref:Uncharacterized protein n=1 Tax=Oceanobacillus kimchii TaxID=746691 RepID=A0ABQ5TPR2_9BACI|nr:hypothetical protein [Oceanobacillus kimchii]GLO68401.1 hypothetical protein MACH08_41850 [Oceanobacillus kimchii]